MTENTWYCQLGNHNYEAAEVLPYKVLCGPHAGRECTCREGVHTLSPCDYCGEGHEARCTVWACPEHYEATIKALPKKGKKPTIKRAKLKE